MRCSASVFIAVLHVLDCYGVRLMSENPERPYIGRIIAMWQDKAGNHFADVTRICSSTALSLSPTLSRVMLDPREVVL